MNIEGAYQDILARLKRGERPLVKLNSPELAALKAAWKDASTPDELHAILCILDNTQTFSQEFDDLIVAALAPGMDDQTIIYTLSVASKHMIAARARSGDQIPGRFIDALGELLNHKNPEVLEWTLRTLAELGRHARRLKPKLLEHRPGLSAIFNIHKRNAQEIIDLLLRTW